jgi:hypothetical protein
MMVRAVIRSSRPGARIALDPAESADAGTRHGINEKE